MGIWEGTILKLLGLDHVPQQSLIGWSPYVQSSDYLDYHLLEALLNDGEACVLNLQAELGWDGRTISGRLRSLEHRGLAARLPEVMRAKSIEWERDSARVNGTKLPPKDADVWTVTLARLGRR